jgi:hypothetical protein
MLTMNIDKSASQFFEHAQGTQVAVDVHPVAPRSGQHTPKYQLRHILTDEFMLPEMMKERMGFWEVEGCFQLGLIFPGTDLIG